MRLWLYSFSCYVFIEYCSLTWDNKDIRPIGISISIGIQYNIEAKFYIFF